MMSLLRSTPKRWVLSGLLVAGAVLPSLAALPSLPSLSALPGVGRSAALAPPSDPPRAELHRLIEDVPGADAYRYGARDSAGRSMDTAKIVADPAGGYLAVYHTYLADVPHVSLATSTDLLTWTFRRELGTQASQAAITGLSDGGFLVVWEQEPANHVAFLYYPSRTALFAGAAARRFDAPRTLSTCSEGTPNIYSAVLAPDIAHSTIDVGGHYHWNCDVDREQRGTLTNFATWRTGAQPEFDNALLYWGSCGNIGDRDAFTYRGFPYGVVEGQGIRDDFGSWRSFVYDYQTGNAEPLAMRTHRGSTAFANPAATILTGPAGTRVIVVSMFVPTEGAAAGESGELVYYRTLPA
jgi:hypothetical protein